MDKKDDIFESMKKIICQAPVIFLKISIIKDCNCQLTKNQVGLVAMQPALMLL